MIDTYHTMVAKTSASCVLKGVKTASPNKKFANRLPAKHSNMLDTQHASGCFRENIVEPEMKRKWSI
jgi:hypothetical protein